MPKQPALPVAYVEWVDSQTSYGWRKFDLRQGDDEPCVIRSVGIVAHQNRVSVSLSTSQSKNGNVVDFITIPRSAIKKLKKLKV